MKTLKSLLLTLLVVFTVTKTNAQVGIGTTNPFAALDVFSNNNGLLIPRVALTATTDVLPVLTGTESELVYNTTDNLVTSDVSPGFYYLSAPGGPWVRLGAGATNSWLITGNTNIDGTNFLGTGASTNVDVAFKRNNLAAGRIATTSTSFGVGALNAGAATNSTAFGNNALSVSTGSNNCAFGQNALQNCNTTAQWNTAFGTNALKGINTNAAQNNVAVGFNAMGNGIGNISNVVAIGANALSVNTASNVTAVGNNALQVNGSSPGNTAVGASTMEQYTAGSNTAVGFKALFNGTGTGNVAIGYESGQGPHGTGTLCTMIGFQASAPGLTNATAIGNGATATVSNTMKFGNASITANNFTGCIITTGNVQGVNFAACSDFRYKKDIQPISSSLNTLNKLKAVNYYFKTEKELKADGVNTNAFKGDETHEKQIGFIAQDVEILLPEVVHTNSDGYKSIDYSKFSPFIIEAVQEQQALIEQLQKANAELVKANAAILKRLAKLEKSKSD